MLKINLRLNIEDRLIFALDVSEVSKAKEIVVELDDSINFYKIGMELLMTGQYFELLDWLIAKDKKDSMMYDQMTDELIKSMEILKEVDRLHKESGIAE